jgi:threonine dehydrogenase-like Zn-dependent dehydrogenase
MSLDTPATIAILGSGPIGLEAALYARFLGYDVILIDQQGLADRLSGHDTDALDLALADLTSTLGRAALTSHDADWGTDIESSLESIDSWYSSYVVPLSQTDLLASLPRLAMSIGAITVTEEGLLLEADGDQQESLNVDAVIDVDGTCAGTQQVYQLPRVALDEITAAGLRESFQAGLSAIRKLFADLGGRQELDLYDSVGHLPGADDSSSSNRNK